MPAADGGAVGEHTPRLRTARFLGRWVAGGCALFLLYSNVVGLPGCMSRRLLSSMSGEEVVIDASRVRLRGIRTLVFRDFRLYRTRRLGPAAVAVDGLVVRFGPGWGRGSWVRPASVDAWNVRVLSPQLLDPRRSRRQAYRPFRISTRLGLPITMHDVDLDGISFAVLSCYLSCGGDEFACRNVEGGMGEGLAGALSGDVTFDTTAGRLHASLGTTVDPRRLAPFFEMLNLSRVNTELARFGFADESPHTRLEVAHLFGQTNTLVRVRFLTRQARYRGVATSRLDGLLRFERSPAGSTLSLLELLVERPEGVGRGAFTYPFGSGLATFEVTGGVNPLAMLALSGVSTSQVGHVVSVFGQTGAEAAGVVDLKDGTRTRVTGVVTAARASLWGRLPLQTASAEIELMGNRLLVTNVVGSSADGSLTGWALVDVPRDVVRTNRTTIAFELEDSAFGTLLSDLGVPREGLSGLCTVSGRLMFDRHGETQSQRGDVRVRVRDGEVFSLPLFGGFSTAMGTLLPGLDFVLRPSEAKVDIEVVDKRLHARRLVVQGDVLSLSGDGHYDIGGDLDLDIQAKLMKEHTLVAKVLRVVTYPVSWLLEFHVNGPLEAPHWYPVNFSSDLLRKLGLGDDDEVDKKDG